jgi:YfiH family protein
VTASGQRVARRGAPLSPPAPDGLPSLDAPLFWRQDAGLVWIEAPLPGGRAVFTTRLGGASEGPYRSLNLGILTEDPPDRVTGNRSLLAAAVGRDPDRIAMGLQVHGNDVERHTAPPDGRSRGRGDLAPADGQATDHPDVTPLVLTADCVPVALSTPGAVALVHCGWRGVAAGIVDRAVEAVCELADRKPAEVGAALGPGIGPCCYPVGDEVRAAMRARGDEGALLTGGALDLPLVLRIELERAGLRAEAISHAGLCTSCLPDLFFSHRRDGGITGRQAGVGWRTP